MHAKCAAEMQTMKTQMTAMRSELEAQRLRVAAQIEETETQNKMQEFRMTEERQRWHAEAQTQKAQIETLRRKLEAQREQAGEQERVWKGQQQAWEEARTNLELELCGTQTERAHLEAEAAASKAHGESLQHRVDAAEHERSKMQALRNVFENQFDSVQQELVLLRGTQAELDKLKADQSHQMEGERRRWQAEVQAYREQKEALWLQLSSQRQQTEEQARIWREKERIWVEERRRRTVHAAASSGNPQESIRAQATADEVANPGINTTTWHWCQGSNLCNGLSNMMPEALPLLLPSDAAAIDPNILARNTATCTVPVAAATANIDPNILSRDMPKIQREGEGVQERWLHNEGQRWSNSPQDVHTGTRHSDWLAWHHNCEWPVWQPHMHHYVQEPSAPPHDPPSSPPLLGPGDNFVGLIKSIVSRTSGGRLNTFLFVQGQGLPENGMYCSVNEYQTTKLVLLHSGNKSGSMKLDRIKESLDFFASTQVTGKVVSCSGGIEGRRLRFDGALQLLSPQQKARLERDLSLHDLFSPVCLRAVISQTVPDKAIATRERQGQDGVATEVYRVALTHPKLAPAVGLRAPLQMRGLALENITPPKSPGPADNEGEVLQVLVSEPRDEVRQAEGEGGGSGGGENVLGPTRQAAGKRKINHGPARLEKKRIRSQRHQAETACRALAESSEAGGGGLPVVVVVEEDVTEETQCVQGAGEQERAWQEERERKRGRGMERDIEISRDEAGQAWVSGVSSKKPRAREASPCGQGMGVCEGVPLQERGAGGVRCEGVGEGGGGGQRGDRDFYTLCGHSWKCGRAAQQCNADTKETTRLHPTGKTVVRMPSIFEMCT
jgi:hypothetical protein